MHDDVLPELVPLSNRLKAAIRAHYRAICQYCGADGATQVEHIIALAKGGPDTLGNATLSCQPCNARKLHRDLDPMFLAIAHARARDSAGRILRAATPPEPKPEQPRAAPRPATNRPTGPTERKGQSGVIYSSWNLSWGVLSIATRSYEELAQPGVVTGLIKTDWQGHHRGLKGTFPRGVQRPQGACRNLDIEFRADLRTNQVALVVVKAAEQRKSVEATEYETKAGARYLRKQEPLILDDALCFWTERAKRLARSDKPVSRPVTVITRQAEPPEVRYPGTCPRCKVEEGKPCIAPSGRPHVWLHTARRPNRATPSKPPAPKARIPKAQIPEGWVPVSGETYPVRNTLRAMGGRWDTAARRWLVPPEKWEAAQDLVDGLAAHKRDRLEDAIRAKMGNLGLNTA